MREMEGGGEAARSEMMGYAGKFFHDFGRSSRTDRAQRDEIKGGRG